MFARTSLRLSTPAVRCIGSCTPVRGVEHTPVTETKTNIPQVPQGEKAWCDIYGVDYVKQIAESLHECPAAAVADALETSSSSSGLLVDTRATSKTDVWNVVFGRRSSA